ncbi:uncharacterized protein LOC113451654 [Pseudonaja textilis]|uniref:uncharacterized protein LOC113451654 n=1 Tax=Pseudonaja textilis TaxID=8673 RepID=UPI000EA98B0B|nr:uncharacterized protein LOC113451654 [Pseudonaja textilis]
MVSSRTEVEDGMEMHVCRIYGFYPREIDASWRRDGEVWLEDTLHGFVVPNADGTCHSWLSIQIDPKERGRYQCHVEHNGLQEPLDMALKEPTNSKSNLGVIVDWIVDALILMCVIAGILVFFSKYLFCAEQSAERDDKTDTDDADTPFRTSELDVECRLALLPPPSTFSAQVSWKMRECRANASSAALLRLLAISIALQPTCVASPLLLQQYHYLVLASEGYTAFCS